MNTLASLRAHIARLEAENARLWQTLARRTGTPVEILQMIRREVCMSFGVDWEEIVGEGREAEFCAARTEVARRLRDDHGFSLPRIGRILHRDHSSIAYMLKRVRLRRAARAAAE